MSSPIASCDRPKNAERPPHLPVSRGRPGSNPSPSLPVQQPIPAIPESPRVRRAKLGFHRLASLLRRLQDRGDLEFLLLKSEPGEVESATMAALYDLQSKEVQRLQPVLTLPVSR